MHSGAVCGQHGCQVASCASVAAQGENFVLSFLFWRVNSFLLFVTILFWFNFKVDSVASMQLWVKQVESVKYLPAAIQHPTVSIFLFRSFHFFLNFQQFTLFGYFVVIFCESSPAGSGACSLHSSGIIGAVGQGCSLTQSHTWTHTHCSISILTVLFHATIIGGIKSTPSRCQVVGCASPSLTGTR